MTAPTPERMRALAASNDSAAVKHLNRRELHELAVESAAALRAAADSVEQWIRIATKLGDRIDGGPHDRLCGSFSWNSNGTGWDYNPENCNCWKSELL